MPGGWSGWSTAGSPATPPPARPADWGAARDRRAGAPGGLGGISRRLVQTMVVFVVLAASTAAALLGLTLLTSANEVFY